MAVLDPNKLDTLTNLALAINKELGLPEGSPDRSTLWRRIHHGVRADDGTICFLKAARDGKKSLSCFAWWIAHVREVGARDEAQRIANSVDDTRRRRPPGKHLSTVDASEAAEAANLAAQDAGW